MTSTRVQRSRSLSSLDLRKLVPFHCSMTITSPLSFWRSISIRDRSKSSGKTRRRSEPGETLTRISKISQMCAALRRLAWRPSNLRATGRKWPRFSVSSFPYKCRSERRSSQSWVSVCMMDRSIAFKEGSDVWVTDSEENWFQSSRVRFFTRSCVLPDTTRMVCLEKDLDTGRSHWTIRQMEMKAKEDKRPDEHIHPSNLNGIERAWWSSEPTRVPAGWHPNTLRMNNIDGRVNQ